ncbi:DNA polymerase III subunit beta [Streptomyces sp. NPDC057623]|uniref:DNA polymerase III subunit beta n=1 Tax=Streptomyces sp. NPDC057623 TaxID=3346187 RepID=UPI0036C6E4BA
MEFRIERAAFAEAVGWAGRALPSRTPVPVLGGLLLAVGPGRLTASGFDFEAAARIEVDAETGAAGEVLVPGRRLLDICRVLPDGPVSCSLEGTRFTVAAGGTEFGLSTLPREEYPALPAQPAPYGSVDAAAFAAAVGQVAVAAGRDETLPVLTGVQLRLDGDSMTLSASDRYRYAVRRVGWKPEGVAGEGLAGGVGGVGGAEGVGGAAGADGVVEALVPARRLLDAARSLARCGGVRVGLETAAGGGLIGFEGGGMRSVVRLLDGRLPAYGSLFDMAGAAVAEVGCGVFTEAVRRVAVVAEASSPVRLDFSADGSVLLRAGYGDDVAAQRLPAVLSGAQEVTVAFNPAYLLDALNSFEAARLRLEMVGSGQRVLVSGVEEGSGGSVGAHRHLLMSVKQLV